MAKLRPRARIVRTIGDQLISGPEAALIEIVKNAYDADSLMANIKISPPSKLLPTGSIIISDNGHGMTYSDILNRWFEPATDEKKIRKTSPNGRLMLGAKGIGRFASSRLGSKTVLQSISIVDGQKQKVLVQVDWDSFSDTMYLDEVEIEITDAVPAGLNETTGVQLCITDLRDNWTQSRLEALIKELRRLITASDDSDDSDDFKIFLDLDDFKITATNFDGEALLRDQNAESFSLEYFEQAEKNLILPYKLNSHSDYLLTGKFDIHGNFVGEFTNFKADSIPTPLKVNSPLLNTDEAHCGSVYINIKVNDRESESVEALFTRMGYNFDKIGIRAARQMLNENSGIAIFRNNFRIRPYGEPESDWLELERQRVNDPSKKLGLTQTSGKVIIADEYLSGLIERSSREGLEHNEQFARLKSLIQGILIHIEQRRATFREKVGLSRKKSGDVGKIKDVALLKNVKNAVSNIPVEYQDSINKAIEKDALALNTSIDEVDEYQKVLQSRAALGLVVAQIIHEGRRILNPLADTAKLLFKNKDSILETTKLGEVLRANFPDHLKMILNGTSEMSRLFKRLDPVSGRKRGKPANFNMKKSVEDSLELFENALNENNINLNMDLNSEQILYGYLADFQTGVLNIVENAIHWLSSSKQQQKEITITAKPSSKYVDVYIENNGPLIDDDYLPMLFSPGFSLKSDGTGLGLSIAREACRASKGDLIFKDDFANTCFMIRFPIP